ncbi:MAG: Peptidoglycan-associated lipoprotein [Candidatus Celerinatantimonas neptuna]|nr:MAG: Peptidoglycan-associated lipoprotein [Candidatus Celerinatantimonas neptuna]
MCHMASANCELPHSITYHIGLLQDGYQVKLNSQSMDDYSESCQAVYNHSVVYFAFDQSRLNLQAKRALNRFLKSQKENSIELQVTGYTDSIGTRLYNKHLGLARAKAVAAYLESRGVLRRHIIISSEGELKPTASNKTSGGRASNRRAVLIID